MSKRSSFKLLISTIIIFIAITSCGVLEPNTHEITIENQRDETVNINCQYSAGETFKFFTVSAKSTKKETIETEKSYSITISSSAGAMSIPNGLHKDIYIIIPPSGKPYVKP